MVARLSTFTAAAAPHISMSDITYTVCMAVSVQPGYKPSLRQACNWHNPIPLESHWDLLIEETLGICQHSFFPVNSLIVLGVLRKWRSYIPF